MSNKAIDKEYLLRQLQNFDDDILEDKYQGKVEEMTQAEYDALSEEEKNDGTIRFITDGTPGGGGTTVIANPEGTASEDLTKLQVGAEIYSIPQSGTEALISDKVSTKVIINKWVSKTWYGSTDFYGKNIWTDGENIYYSNGTSAQYVLNKSTGEWSEKTWVGISELDEHFCGKNIWTDGENIYYSYPGSGNYILNKSTGEWSEKTWSGIQLAFIYGEDIWTDGENIYYSYYSNGTSMQYVLNKSTSTWTTKTWTGVTAFNGKDIWTDGENIYYSDGSSSCVLNKSSSKWETKTWTGITALYTLYIWTDGENIYYSNGNNGQYVLNKSTSTWTTKTWTGMTAFNGENIWTDGENIYYSVGGSNYILLKEKVTVRVR